MTSNEVTLKEITEDTLISILKLDVQEHQKQFVAPNAVSIAQAHFSKHAWFRAIYADDTPVGFVMLSLDTETPEYWVWRFMIDQRYQGKGYGTRAMQQIIEHVKQQPNAKELVLSYAPGEGNPSPFYKKVGFVETGEWDEEHLEKVMKFVFEEHI